MRLADAAWAEQDYVSRRAMYSPRARSSTSILLSEVSLKAKGEAFEGHPGGRSGRGLLGAGARGGGSVAGCGKKSVGGADRKRSCGRGRRQRRATNSSTLSLAWRAMRRSMLPSPPGLLTL